MSEDEARLRYLLTMAHGSLVRAEALLKGDTEYLRDELTQLMESTEVLLEKMNFEQLLLDLRDELHDVDATANGSDTAHGTDGSDEANGSSEASGSTLSAE